MQKTISENTHVNKTKNEAYKKEVSMYNLKNRLLLTIYNFVKMRRNCKIHLKNLVILKTSLINKLKISV